MTRSASDNFNLDLMIAERFGMTLDQVDALPLGLVEIVREAIWLEEEAFIEGHEQCNHTFERDEVMINVCTKCGIEGEQD